MRPQLKGRSGQASYPQLAVTETCNANAWQPMGDKSTALHN